MQRIPLTDVDIVDKVKILVGNRKPFIICADRNFPHLHATMAMMRSFQGLPDERGVWRSFWDALNTRDWVTCWGIAVNRHQYQWNWQETEDGIESRFYPSK